MRDEALHAAWESCRDRWPVDWADFAQAMQGWEVEPVEVDGRIVGAVLMRGPEIHVAVTDEGKRRWLSRRLIRKTLGDLVLRYGVAVTSVMNENERGHAFVQRMGFKRVGELPWAVRYEYRGRRHV